MIEFLLNLVKEVILKVFHRRLEKRKEKLLKIYETKLTHLELRILSLENQKDAIEKEIRSNPNLPRELAHRRVEHAQTPINRQIERLTQMRQFLVDKISRRKS